MNQHVVRQVSGLSQRLASNQQPWRANRRYISVQQTFRSNAGIVATSIANRHIDTAAADIRQAHIG